MDKPSIAVEVVYALADKQKLLQMTVPAGTTVREAALRSGLDAHFPGLDLAAAPFSLPVETLFRYHGPAVPWAPEGKVVQLYRPPLCTNGRRARRT